jgi:low temperature requirement protein LtrA
MSEPAPIPALRIRVRMTARAVDEPHRVSSQLELLFDLTFVVAVSFATAQLARALAAGAGADDVLAFLEVFFAIWWAWMNFTWFASAYDTDDVAYRLLTMLQMAGVLVLAAGVPAAAADADYRAMTAGYLVMRTGLVAQWLRASVEDPASRATARRYAAGIAGAQLGWLALLFLAGTGSPVARLPAFLALVALELTVPRWAERRRATTWHPHHIAERYGLFTIILLGEIVLAATTAVQRTIGASRVSPALVTVAACALLLVFAQWWLYFLHPAGAGLAERRAHSYRWGYGHYVVFSALAALGAGLDVAVEATAGTVRASAVVVSYAVAVPVAAFLLALWAVHLAIAPVPPTQTRAVLASVAVVLLAPPIARWSSPPVPIAIVTAVCVALTAVTTIARRRAEPVTGAVEGHNGSARPVLAGVPQRKVAT